jgi:hypothetical protein
LVFSFSLTHAVFADDLDRQFVEAIQKSRTLRSKKGGIAQSMSG